MECYVISPLANLELMEEGHRIFALAHLYVKPENGHYRDFLKAKKKEGYWITLDNGAAEQDLVTEDVLIDAVKDLMPNEVIAPDVLFNHIETMSNLDKFVERMDKENLLGKVEIFYAPQGSEVIDWLEAYKYGLNHPHVKTIGMSKIAVPYAWMGVEKFSDEMIKEARVIATIHLADNDLIKKPLHYLGAGDPREFSDYRRLPELKKVRHLLRSTDSCFTIWAAMNGIDFATNNYDRVKTPHDYFDRIVSEDEIAASKRNISALKELL